MSLSLSHLASQISRVSQISQRRPKETQGGPRETQERPKRRETQEIPEGDPKETRRLGVPRRPTQTQRHQNKLKEIKRDPSV